MINKIKNTIYQLLKSSEKWTKTDMIYLGKNSFWLTLSQIISSASSFVLVLAFANLLSKDAYGTYKFVLSIIGILGITSLQGMGTSLAQAVARGFEGNFKQVFKTKLKFGILGSITSLIIALYYFLNNNLVLSVSFTISAAFIPFINSLQIYSAYLNGKKLFDVFSKNSIFVQIFSTCLLLVTLYFTNNIFFILFAYLLGLLISRLLAFLKTIKDYPPNEKTENSIISYGKHLSAIEILKIIAGNLDKILIFHYVGAADLAIYTIALAPVTQIKSLALNLKTIAFPKLSNTSIEEIKKTLPKKVFQLEIILLLISIIYIILSPFLFKIFFPDYLDSIFFSQIMAPLLIFTPRTFYTLSLKAKKQLKSLYKVRVIAPVFKITLLIFLTKTYGVIGLIAATYISELFLIILYRFYFNQMS